MPSLKEIKTRIASVNSTRKITSAMKMVASSKLHHAQVAIQNMLPYGNMLEHILKSFLVSTPNVDHPLQLEHKETKRVALVVYSSNSSLCGGFNSNVIKMMMHAVDEYKAQGIDDITVYPIGRKVAEKAQKLGLKIGGNFNDLADHPHASACADIAHSLAKQYAAGELDKVEMIYHHFKSAGSQILTRKTFLPIDLSTEAIGVDNDRDLTSNVATAKAQEYLRQKQAEADGRQSSEAKPLNDDFIVEPDLETVLGVLIPKQLRLMIYTALLDSQASEHAARMVAMHSPDQYRAYAMPDGGDDYGTLYAWVARRLESGPPWPDLMLIDGGRGQLAVVERALADAGKADFFPLAAIAKARDEAGHADRRAGNVADRIFLPGRSNPLPLREGCAELLFLQNVRDATHRFAIGRHRKARGQAALSGELMRLPGIGPATARLLWETFGSLEAMRAASVDDLRRLPGIGASRAALLHEKLKGLEG